MQDADRDDVPATPKLDGPLTSPSANRGLTSGGIARWGGALLVIALTVLLSSISAGGDRLLMCDNGAGEPCRPVEMTDTPVVCALLFAALLLLPDLKRLSIGGLVELERSIDDTRQEVTRTREDVGRLAIAMQSTVNANAQNALNLYLQQGQAAALEVDRLDEKAATKHVI